MLHLGEGKELHKTNSVPNIKQTNFIDTHVVAALSREKSGRENTLSEWMV